MIHVLIFYSPSLFSYVDFSWNAMVSVLIVEILMVKTFNIFSSLLTALWKLASDSLKIARSSANNFVFKTVLCILNFLVKASSHCLMTAPINISDNVGDKGHPCFTLSFICISLLLTDIPLSIFILVLTYRLWTGFIIWSGNPLSFIVFHNLPRATLSNAFSQYEQYIRWQIKFSPFVPELRHCIYYTMYYKLKINRRQGTGSTLSDWSDRMEPWVARGAVNTVSSSNRPKVRASETSAFCLLALSGLHVQQLQDLCFETMLTWR